MSKTWLLTWQFHHIWKEHNVPVVFVTKEIGARTIQQRFDAIDCNLPYDALRRGLLSPQQKKIYFNRIKEIEERTKNGELAPYAIKGFDLTDGTSGVSSIIPYVEQYLHSSGVLFIDGMYLMPDDRGESDWRGMVNIAMDLKILAQTYNIPIVVTTQQNMTDKSDKPSLENAAYGRYIVQYADLVMGIGRTDVDRKANRGTAYILGYREGDVGEFVINMKFNPMDFSQHPIQVIPDYDDEDEEVYSPF